MMTLAALMLSLCSLAMGYAPTRGRTECYVVCDGESSWALPRRQRSGGVEADLDGLGLVVAVQDGDPVAVD